jgi:MoaA/NifB/PqqE/SkfB family radical SAM enzyme
MTLKSKLQPYGLDPRSLYDKGVKYNLFKPSLYTVVIETTNACNLKCKICQSRGSRPTGFMSEELFSKAITQARDMKVQQVGLYLGGEPLLHPKFLDFLARACTLIPSVVYYSNGNFLDENIAQKSIDFGVDIINISLDGAGECHERMRPGSDYKKVKKNIEKLLEIRGGKAKPLISVNMMLYDQTQEEIQDFISEWQNKVDYAGISVSKPSSFYRDYSHPFWSESKTYDVPYCRSLYYYMAVLWDGRVIPCCDVTGAEVLGDLNKESLQDIWFGEKYKQARKMELETCKTCNVWQKHFVTRRTGNIEYNDIYKNYLRNKWTKK